MRFSSFSLSIALLMLLYGSFVHAQSTSNAFAANLSLGSRGTQVTLLQQILNRDPDTRITDTGPGSSGNETDYFGPLTKTAVARFQAKYANEVLTPAGLAQGNGYVGFYTRMKLNTLTTVATDTQTTTSTSPAISATTASQNPNLKNLDMFLAAIDKTESNKGLSQSAIATVKQQIVNEVSTTTDLRAAFLKTVQNSSHQSIDTNFPDKVLAAVVQIVRGIFAPEALAATGIPFGGALVFPFYCEDSANWLLTMQPLPPSFAELLSYEPGSQAFLSYNIPGTPELLGEYEPPGVCVFACPDCIVITSEGTITPLVGSAP